MVVYKIGLRLRGWLEKYFKTYMKNEIFEIKELKFFGGYLLPLYRVSFIREAMFVIHN